MRCLYKKLYRRCYISKLPARESPLSVAGIGHYGASSAHSSRSAKIPHLGAFHRFRHKKNTVAAVFLRGGPPRGPPARISTVGNVPRARLARFHARNKIYGSELLAPLASLWMHLGFFAGSSVNLYMDSNNCIASLTRGDTCDDFTASAVALFWRLTHRYSIDLWIGRVRSKLKIADPPTKKAALPFQVVKKQASPNPPLLLTRVKLN